MTNQYNYRACGLDNVIIHGLKPVNDDEGNETYAIPHINKLHKTIAILLIEKPFALNGQELRFLRSELGMTQAELAKLVNRQPLTISRWERDEIAIEDNAEVIIRLYACKKLEINEIHVGIEDLVRKVTPSATGIPINIDGSDPDNYRPIAA